MKPAASTQVPHRFFVLAASVLVVAGLYLAQAVLIPITLSVLFAFLLSPLVDRLKKWGVGHRTAVAIVGGLTLLALLVLAALFTMQVADLLGNLPSYTHKIREKFQAIGGPLQEFLGRVQQGVEQMSPRALPIATNGPQAVTVMEVSSPGQIITSWLRVFAAPVGIFAIVTVLAGAILLQAADLRDRIVRLVGHGQVSVTTQALDDVAAKVSAYLLAQTILNGLQGAAIAIGLLVIGVPNAVFFAIFWAILRYLPYIGPWLGAIFPVLTALGHFEGLRDPILTIALFVVVELIGNMILEPWFYGRRTGLSPMAVIISAVFWTWLWGWIGLLLATPMTVCLAVLGKYVEPLEFLHVLLGDKPVLRPSTKLYQRLLSQKLKEAREVMLEEFKKRGTVEVFQHTIVRALALVEEDRLKGRIADAKAEEIVANVREVLDRLPDPVDLPGDFSRVGTALCIPARDEADVLCGRMLQILCEHRGIEVILAQGGYLASEKADLVVQLSPDVVVVSALTASRASFLRHTVRSIAARCDISVVAGIWHGDGEAARAADDLGAVTVTTFTEAIDAISSAIHAQKGARARQGKPPVPAQRELENVASALVGRR